MAGPSAVAHVDRFAGVRRYRDALVASAGESALDGTVLSSGTETEVYGGRTGPGTGVLAEYYSYASMAGTAAVEASASVGRE